MGDKPNMGHAVNLAHHIVIFPDELRFRVAGHFEDPAAMRLDGQHVAVRQDFLDAAGGAVERLLAAAVIAPDHGLGAGSISRIRVPPQAGSPP